MIIADYHYALCDKDNVKTGSARLICSCNVLKCRVIVRDGGNYIISLYLNTLIS